MKKILAGIGDYIRYTDKLLWALCLFCSGLSILLLVSQAYYGFITSRVVITQVVASAIGIVAVVVISKMDYHMGITFWKWHAVAVFVLVALTFVFGIQNPGADDKAWLPIPFTSLTIQPSELLKLSFIFTFAKHLASVGENINQYKNIILLCIHGAYPVLFIILQGDDGTALSLLFIFIVMIFCAGISYRYVAAGIAALGVALPLLWNFFMGNYQKQRILVLFNLEADAQGMGYQQLQGKIAIGSGRVFGVGLFSDQIPREVPYMRNDFIFSYAGETLGFIGALLIVVVLLTITGKVLMTARRSQDKIGYYVCVGIFAILIFQIFANIGMCLGIMPVIGLTLPFFSAGGTSVVMLYLAVGIVQSVYMHNKRELFS